MTDAAVAAPGFPLIRKFFESLVAKQILGHLMGALDSQESIREAIGRLFGLIGFLVTQTPTTADDAIFARFNTDAFMDTLAGIVWSLIGKADATKPNGGVTDEEIAQLVTSSNLVSCCAPTTAADQTVSALNPIAIIEIVKLIWGIIAPLVFKTA